MKTQDFSTTILVDQLQMKRRSRLQVVSPEKDNDRQQEEENGKFMNTVGYYGNYNSKKQLHNYAQIIFHALEMVQLKTVKQ